MTEQRDSIPAPLAEKSTFQKAECEKCGRVAAVVCLACHRTCDSVPSYTAGEVEDMILRWCGFPEQTVENVRHALAMESTGGIDRSQEKPT